MLGKDCDSGASHKRRVWQNLLQVCRCGEQLLPFRQVAFGHISSRSDIAARMDQTGEVWKPEGSALESQCDLPQRREAPSSHRADRGRLHRRLLPVSTQNDSDDGAACVWIISAWM